MKYAYWQYIWVTLSYIGILHLIRGSTNQNTEKTK